MDRAGLVVSRRALRKPRRGVDFPVFEDGQVKLDGFFRVPSNQSIGVIFCMQT